MSAREVHDALHGWAARLVPLGAVVVTRLRPGLTWAEAQEVGRRHGYDLTEEVAARAEDNTRQADSSGEAGTALPFVVDNTTGQVFVKGREVGTLQLSESLFGTALFFKRAPQ